MSRIGKRPVALPSGVSATAEGETLSVKGPKGVLSLQTRDEIRYDISDEGISVQPANATKAARAFWGMQRTLVQKYAAKYAKLKAIADDESRDETERMIARLKMAEIPRNGNPTRIRNRCELTGRSRAYYRKFRLSRIMLRELANKGLIPGVVKSSW